jgi:membrane-bound serine protease (ClpP class)
MRVHYGVAAGAGIGFGVITFGLAWIAVRARKSKRLTGPEAMVGHLAVAMTPLAPTGQVEVRGEIWAARLASGVEGVSAGTEVKVEAVDGLTLRVTTQ